MPIRSVVRSANPIFTLIAAACLSTACLINGAAAQAAKTPDDPGAAVSAKLPAEDLPEGFVPANVKSDAPDEIRAFFETSDKTRLAAIAAHLGRIEANKAKMKAAKKRGEKSDELESATETAGADSAVHGTAVAALLKNVGYVAPFETMPRGSESRVLNPRLILRFGRPVSVARVIDKVRAGIIVEQQLRAPRRLNKAGQMIEPIELKRVQAVVKTGTARMKAGANTQITATLHVTGSEAIDGTTVFVLEPFPIADYLEE